MYTEVIFFPPPCKDLLDVFIHFTNRADTAYLINLHSVTCWCSKIEQDAVEEAVWQFLSVKCSDKGSGLLFLLVVSPKRLWDSIFEKGITKKEWFYLGVCFMILSFQKQSMDITGKSWRNAEKWCCKMIYAYHRCPFPISHHTHSWELLRMSVIKEAGENKVRV